MSTSCAAENMSQSPLAIHHQRARAQARQVLAELRAQGVSAKSVQSDSRIVEAGDLFVAIPGRHYDPRNDLANIVQKGAAAIVFEAGEVALPRVPAVPVENLHAVSGFIADEVYQYPSAHMFTAGVTGTNGKTSVSQWIAQAMGVLERRCAVVGTLGSGLLDNLRPTQNTTPEAIALQRELARCVEEGAQVAALEVSSIGLDQQRLNGMHFDVAVLTNLSRDHLDYHGDMANYAEAKAQLFDWPNLKAAVLNLNDEFGCQLAKRLEGRGITRIGYCIEQPDADARVDVLLIAKELDAANRMHFSIEMDGVHMPVQAATVGRFNVANLMAVCGVMLAADVPFLDAAAVLSRLQPPPGRMQMLGGFAEPLVLVDYAHTPDALAKVLETLRDSAAAREGKVWVVVGCGGDRDKGKRPQMASVAATWADHVVLTSDNPRSESPEEILAQMQVGAPNALVIVDRAQAIQYAVTHANDADVVLIAGKGHEAYQEIKGERFAFSDVQEAHSALEMRV